MDFLADRGVRVRYMHSDIDAIERVEILRDLRLGIFDVLVGINLLREGLDLPEVSLVAILDADKEGFLRSNRSLVQTIGRAARNLDGAAVLYADRVTEAMHFAIEETERRRRAQAAYNLAHDIEPRSIIKSVDEIRFTTRVADARDPKEPSVAEALTAYGDLEPEELIERLEAEMKRAAERLDFERAASIRDELFDVKSELEPGRRPRSPRSRLGALKRSRR